MRTPKMPRPVDPTTMPTRSDEDRPDPRKRRVWIAIAVVVLVIGSSASILAGFSWDRYQQNQSRSAFADTASTVATAIGTGVMRDLDFTAAFKGIVVAAPQMTNQQVSAWTDTIDASARYPGSFGYGYVEPVPFAELPAFIRQIQSDPPDGISVVPYSVQPPGPRPTYCLIALGDEMRPLPLPAGIDFCYPNASWLDSVASSGKTTITSVVALVNGGLVTSALPKSVTRALEGIYLSVTPVYQGTTTPSTAQARQVGLRGWVIGTFSAKALLSSALGQSSGIGVTLRYQDPTGPPVTIGSGGSVPGGATISAVRTVNVGGGTNQTLSVVVAGRATSQAFEQGLLVALGGILLALLLAGFLLYLAQSRRRALRLVDERTGLLRYRALHDTLTALPNRALILDRAEQLLLRSEREPIVIGALYLDIDNFKDINDTFGHQVGDRLLCSVAERLRDALRASDTVGRLGGDEFIVLVEAESLDVGPEMVAERIQAVMTAPFVLESDQPVEMTVQLSIGIAIGRRESADELLRDADVALYEAKAAGKNRAVVFQPSMQSALRERLDLEQDLRRALAADQLFVVYQPIFDLRSVTAKGVEALLRWQHPERGLVMPETFIPMAEETGAIVPIGRFVLQTACRQAAAWQEQGQPIEVAVNVSARQLMSGSFMGDVRAALDETGLDPAMLTLEITETTIMRDTEANTRLLRRLKSLGVRIAIDDFGTGYSSLSYLRQFPIDALKIDRSFITRVSESAQSGALIHTLIQLGQALGIETLAEGIEERAQLAELQREHCDSGQGYLFARPLDSDAIIPFFEKEGSAHRVPPERSASV